MQKVREKLNPDDFGKSTIMNIYLDTPSFLLIRNSIDAKGYKEKLRIRSYGVPDENSKVFFEIKKKHKGIVYKRRIDLPYKEALEYIYQGKKPCDSQIMREIDYAMKMYGNPLPRAVIAYEREAYFWSEDSDIRLTFDKNVRYRIEDNDLMSGSYGIEIIPNDAVLMEVKTAGAIPIELSAVFNECKIYPTSFSKYGKAYTHYMTAKNNLNKKEQLI